MTRSRHPVLSDADASLAETLRVLQERRRFIGLLGAGLGGLSAFALGPGAARACSLIPSETGGPYPGDGTNGPNVLTQTGILRPDIRPSFGSYGTAVAPGTPLTVSMQFLSTTMGCGTIEGLAIYIWHCTAGGLYSLYSQGATGQNYLRGVQVTDANGRVEFTTIFPGCYAGRWPHIHFEAFASIDDATSGNNAGRISQIALPETQARAVYAQSSLYPGSLNNLNRVSLQSDNVFGNDGGVHQLATMSGDNASGYAAFLEVGLAVDATGGNDLIFADGFED